MTPRCAPPSSATDASRAHDISPKRSSSVVCDVGALRRLRGPTPPLGDDRRGDPPTPSAATTTSEVKTGGTTTTVHHETATTTVPKTTPRLPRARFPNDADDAEEGHADDGLLLPTNRAGHDDDGLFVRRRPVGDLLLGP